jgi:hypothetical protein
MDVDTHSIPKMCEHKTGKATHLGLAGKMNPSFSSALLGDDVVLNPAQGQGLSSNPKKQKKKIFNGRWRAHKKFITSLTQMIIITNLIVQRHT